MLVSNYKKGLLAVVALKIFPLVIEKGVIISILFYLIFIFSFLSETNFLV